MRTEERESKPKQLFELYEKHILIDYLCNMTGGFGGRGKLTCIVCVLGLYRHMLRCLPRCCRRPSPPPAASDWRTNSGWIDVTLLGAGGTIGTEIVQIWRMYVTETNLILVH